MQNHPIYQTYRTLRVPPEDYTGTRTRRNYLRSIPAEDLVSLNNAVVNAVLMQGTISEDQVRVLTEIDTVLGDDAFATSIREDGEAYMIEHSYGITIHGNYLGPRKYSGYRTLVKLKVEKVLTSSQEG